MTEYTRPAVTDFGTLRDMTAANILGGFFDCNARPGEPVPPNFQTSQPGPIDCP
jgi:hypothetical protein